MVHPLIKTGLMAIALLAGPIKSSAQTTDPSFNPICGAGQTAGQGCDAIRAREIIDVTQAPWRGIGRVNFAGIRIRTHCTGALVAEQIVLTAAHCLFNAPRKSWIPAQSIRFVAGYQRGEYTATATVSRYVLSPEQDPSSGVFNDRRPIDWALLILDAPIGADAGVLDTAVSAPTPDDTLVMVGYPRLRPHVASLANDCGAVTHVATTGLIITACAAMRGDSGGPLLAVRGDSVQIVGVNISVLAQGSDAWMTSVPPTQWATPLQALKMELDGH